MAEQPFAVGSDVVHKSGGPVMVVIGYSHRGMTAKHDTCECRWFNENNQVQEAAFLPDELKLAAESPKRRSTIHYVTSSKGCDHGSIY